VLTSFWRSFLFLHRVLLSTVRGQTASRNITTGQNFLFWSFHSWELNWYQNKVTAIRRQKICRVPYPKRALLKETEIYVTSVFKTCKAACGYSLPEGRHKLFIKRNVFLSRTVAGKRSQHCKQHLPVCDAIATLLKNKSLTSSNKFIYIVTHVII